MVDDVINLIGHRLLLFLPQVWTQGFEGRHIRMVDKHIQICATLNNKLYGVLDTTLCD